MDLTLAICMYNAEKYIEETLRSVVAQTQRGFNLLLINDFSTDNCAELANKFLARHNRPFEIISFPENMGIAYARHFAERHASTRFMMFLDADDILVPNAIEKLWTKISSDPDLMAVGCYLDYIDRNGKKIGGGLFLGETTKEGFINKAAAGKLIFMQPTAIYNRELALSVGGYVIDGYPKGKPRYQDYCEDLDLWTRMSDLYTDGKAIVVVPEVLCHYRKGGGLSANSVFMILKMRYTKFNVRQRRAGLPEKTFIEFYNSLSPTEISSIQKEAFAADSLRNGFTKLKSGQIISGGCMLIRSLVSNPSYFYQKIKHNLLRIK